MRAVGGAAGATCRKGARAVEVRWWGLLTVCGARAGLYARPAPLTACLQAAASRAPPSYLHTRPARTRPAELHATLHVTTRSGHGEAEQARRGGRRCAGAQAVRAGLEGRLETQKGWGLDTASRAGQRGKPSGGARPGLASLAVAKLNTSSVAAWVLGSYTIV